MPSVSGTSMPSMPTLSSGTSSNNETASTQSSSSSNNVTETTAGYALTAQAISSLSDSSQLSTISSLLGEDTTSLYESLTGTTSSTTSYSTNLLLTQILEKLTQLTENQGSTTSQTTSSDSENVQKPAEKIASSGIVRFRLNDYDFTSSLSGVFISTPEKDGSFFVTGDRTYTLGNKQSRETFYMLFSATKNDSGVLGNYSVAVSVMQDIENPNSFVYKLSNVKNLSAQKTGNLVSLRLNSKELKADILISVE